MDQDSPPPIREFLAHCRAHRLQAARAALAVILPAALAAALIRPTYLATATLAVLPAPEFTVRNAAGSHDSNESALALDQIMKTESAILASEALHQAALRQLGPARVYPSIFGGPPMLLAQALQVAAHAVLAPWRVAPKDQEAARLQRGLRAFQSDLDVVPTREANVITVSFRNQDGAVAAAVVNRLLDLYAASRGRLYEDPQLPALRAAVTQTAAAADAADAALAAFKQAQAISDYPAQRDLLLHRAAQEEQESAEAEAARQQAQARLQGLARALRAEPASLPAYHEQDPDTRLLAVNAALQDQRSKLAAAREKYLDNSRVVTALTASLHAAEAEAARLAHDRTVSVSRQGRNPNLESLRLDQAQASAELAAAAARRESLAQDAARLHRALAALDTAELTLTGLQRRRDAAEANYHTASRLLADRHLTEAEDALRTTKVRVIQPATAPQRPQPIPYLILTAGLFLGAAAAALRLVASYVMHPVFLTAEGLELTSGLPVLADFTAIEEETELTF